jgi:hypothetical protein
MTAYDELRKILESFDVYDFSKSAEDRYVSFSIRPYRVVDVIYLIHMRTFYRLIASHSVTWENNATNEIAGFQPTKELMVQLVFRA